MLLAQHLVVMRGAAANRRGVSSMSSEQSAPVSVSTSGLKSRQPLSAPLARICSESGHNGVQRLDHPPLVQGLLATLSERGVFFVDSAPLLVSWPHMK